MKNREKYRYEILQSLKTATLAEFMGKHVPNYGVADLKGYNDVRFILWLDEEYTEPEVDWSKVEVDTPILVRSCMTAEWENRYFAGMNENRVMAWGDGRTSWSNEESCEPVTWNYAKLAEVES